MPRTLFDTELAARLLGYPAGRPRHDARGAARRPAAEGALRVGLVDPAAAAGVADLRRPGRGAAARAARPAGRPARRRPASGTGPSRSSRRWSPARACRRSRGRTRGGVRRGSTRCAPGAGSATSPSSGHARDAIAARAGPRARQDPGRCRRSASWPRTGTPGRAALRQIPAFARRQARRFEAAWLAALESVRPRRRGGAAADAPAQRRSAAGPALAGQGPGRRGPAGRGTRRR